ncbi:Lipoprotein [Pseudomonas syringae pv. primulae]|uniref:Lipoprotein n=3 Tax=Pseudomonas syringae group TaxID=136849 RepID=A0A0P9XG34_9PSED|nr:Lipoprotein [Pseudomonas syringae pv. primulae]
METRPMFAARSVLVFALLPLFAGCQMLGIKTDTPKVSTAGMIRMQGDLTGENGQLMFKPCNEQRRYVVKDRNNTGILQEAASLADSKGRVFADLRGSFAASKAANSDGQLDLHQVYRVERPGQSCEDLNFKRLTLHVNGNKPAWNVNVSGKGMVLEREGQPPLAVPYLEEQLPDGSFSVSSEANNQRIELWVAPQRCVDSVNGSVQHLTAELRLNGQAQRGCGYYGGSRDD